jgi:hypothetical protein
MPRIPAFSWAMSGETRFLAGFHANGAWLVSKRDSRRPPAAVREAASTVPRHDSAGAFAL